MTWSLVVALTLSQSYVRSRVSTDPASQCLWWLENTQITLHQNDAGNPENGGSEFTAIGAAITTWQTQLNSCSSLSMIDGTRTSSRAVGYFSNQDNENLTVFRLKRCSAVVPAGDSCKLAENDDCGTRYDCWQHQDAAIAITTTTYSPTSGRILDADIEYNQPSFLFTTVNSPVCPSGQARLDCVVTDIQNTTTHELGHVLGLSHSTAAGSTMAARANAGELSKRFLDADTAQFACDVYPKGKPTRTCFIPVVDAEIGKAATGCSSAPWPLLLGVGALLRRRRNRA